MQSRAWCSLSVVLFEFDRIDAITYNSVDNCMLCLYAVNAVVRCDACDHTASASASACLLRACCAVYDAQDKVKPRKSYAWSQLQNVSQKKKNRFELEVSVISVVLPHMGYSVNPWCKTMGDAASPFHAHRE